MQCILGKIYFWKVFHMNYNWICTPICTKILFLQKVGVTVSSCGIAIVIGFLYSEIKLMCHVQATAREAF
jgi:hypothetical protein